MKFLNQFIVILVLLSYIHDSSMVYYIKDKIQLINKNETSKEESKESFEFDFYEEHQHLQYFIFADQFISEVEHFYVCDSIPLNYSADIFYPPKLA